VDWNRALTHVLHIPVSLRFAVSVFKSASSSDVHVGLGNYDNHNHNLINHDCYSALSTSMKTDSALQCIPVEL